MAGVSSLFLAIGIASCIPAAAFNFRWFNTRASEEHWSGWACTGCATNAVFFIVLGNLIR
jgi:hypothetical protein